MYYQVDHEIKRTIDPDFPTDNDINRIFEMTKTDPGFFVLAVYSFIETWMKKWLRDNGYPNDYDGKFRKIWQDFVDEHQKNGFWYSRVQFGNLLRIREEKDLSDEVRHTFRSLDAEHASSAIQNLLNFADVSSRELARQLSPLKSILNSDWSERVTPASNRTKNLQQSNRAISGMQSQLSKIILSSPEYKELLTKLQTLEKQYLVMELQSSESTEKAAELASVNAALTEAQDKLKKEFSTYQDYVKNLQRMLNYTRTRNDFEHTILRLTSEQEKARDRIKFKNDYMIKGSAGTGKSLVLLESIRMAQEQKDLFSAPVIWFVTYTNSLVHYEKYQKRLLNLGLEDDQILTADKFFNEHIQPMSGVKKYQKYESDLKADYLKKIDAIIKRLYPKSGVKVVDIWNEAVSFIWPNLVTQVEYTASSKPIERKGMKDALHHRERGMYWEIIAALEEEMATEKTWPRIYLKNRIAFALQAKNLSNNEKIADYIYIDEAQDLSIAEMACIKAVCKGSVVIARDSDQSIYGVPTPVIRSGIDISGNSITLTTNFRNTVQIHQVAERYRATIAGMNTDSSPRAFRMGPPVELITVSKEDNSNTEFKYNLLAERIKMCINELDYAPENICIITPSCIGETVSHIVQAMEKRGIPAENVKNKDYVTEGKICVSTVQSCKGLDFPVVILLADHRPHGYGSNYSKEEEERIQRSMFYVAMTRAMDLLTIYTLDEVEPDNKVINDLKMSVESENIV